MRCGYMVAAAVGAVVNVGAGATVGFELVVGAIVAPLGGVAFGIGVITGGLVPGEIGAGLFPGAPGALAVGTAGTRGTAAVPFVDVALGPHATSGAATLKNAAAHARKSLMHAAWP